MIPGRRLEVRSEHLTELTADELVSVAGGQMSGPCHTLFTNECAVSHPNITGCIPPIVN